MLKIATGLMLGLSMLAGCEERIKSVNYFSLHLNEALQLMEQCERTLWWSDECTNANEALLQAERASMLMLK